MAENRRGFGWSHVEFLRDRLLQCAAAPVEDAGELAYAAAGHHQRRRLVADRNDNGRRVGRLARPRILRLDERAQQAERLEVDSRELQASALRRLGVRSNLVTRRDLEEDPPRGLAGR